ncbi:MAG TPA: glycosyltransferase family 4 protein [Candidatus Paceibacterota bacterium]|nr:glycosyltransferase family 4 protein [Candidatus Paceibacterota bacterium]
MKILIATPIFPPQVGGPAFYSAQLSEALKRQGHQVTVKTYGALLQLPSGIRHLCFALRLLPAAFSCDAIIALDTFSAGVPAAFVSMLARKPLIARAGGDFLWEGYLERTRELVPLPQIYQERSRWGRRERIVFACVKFVARHARLAFSSRWQLELWREPYQLLDNRVSVIENAIEASLPSHEAARKNFLFYTREIALKNHAEFRSAFAKAKEHIPEIELEEGVLSHAQLLERMQNCYAVVLPSISDITPNYIIDALRCGKPFLLTKYSAYADKFAGMGVVVDPLSVEDMARGIETLADPVQYARMREAVFSFKQVRTYDDVAREFVALLQ